MAMLMLLIVSLTSGCLEPASNDQLVATESRASSADRNTPLVTAENDQSRSQPIEDPDLAVLFIGNSHSRPMPGELQSIFSKLQPTKTVVLRSCNGPFLSWHAKSKKTIALIKSKEWDFVILQGQKYSTSGIYHYPYDGCFKLSRIVNESTSAKIIMFPEWSRREAPDEYRRIDKIHHEIAKETGAIVAPIGLAWKTAIGEFPHTKFHAADGNHASKEGNYLSACVFYGLFTMRAPVDKTRNAKRIQLATIAWNVVQESKAADSSD